MTAGKLGILGMGYHLPPNEITDDFLQKDVGLERGSDWVESRLGIHCRYSVLSRDYIVKTRNKNPLQGMLHARSHGETPETLGIKAALAAIKDAGIRPGDVGMVIANSDTAFDLVPSMAILVAKGVGAGPGPHCDMNSACSSFARHLQAIADMRQDRVPEFVLCVQTDAYTVRTDYSPQSIDAYIFGDGACAQVVSTRHEGKLTAEPLIFETRAEAAETIIVDMSGHLDQDGKTVREFSVRKTCEMFEHIAEVKGLYADEAYTVAHQANYVMQTSILQHLELPEEKHLRNVHLQGNIAAAGCPSAICQNLERLHKGDKIAYAVLGAGLAWGGGYMEVN
ncbi:MAG: 3-oxoacyl-[acyl-carrier-protein] synthase III C-terminal domain-containing protein [Elusimicrobiota bacterium]|jgi:3-oxoacyl-[acyl-carrier-protein] synthase-3